MSFSASSRGASLFGTLVLIGILSSVAIGIEGINQPQAQSQLAQLTASTQSVPVAVEKKTEAEVVQGCMLGYDYVARLENGQMVVQTTLDGTNPTPVRQANKCNPPKDANGNIRSVAGERMCAEDGPSAWRCKLRMCVPKELTKEGKNPECKYMKEVALGGKFNDYADDVKKSASEQVKNNIALATPERASQIAKASSGVLGGDFSTNLFTAFGGQKELDAIPAQVYNAEQELLRLQASNNCSAAISSAGASDVSSCPMPSTNKSEAQLEREIEDLKRREATLKALAQNKTSLQPATIPSPQGSDEIYCLGYSDFEQCEKDKQAKTQQSNSQNKPPPDNHMKTGFQGDPDPFDFLARNSGQDEDRYLCERYNDRAACMRISTGGYGGGYGAYGGYGNAMGQSNRCGSQPNFGGGLGGIISGVISLFTKNGGGNSNCTPDGVPKPQCTITASPTNIQSPGQQVTLSWQSEDAFAATLSSNGSVGVNGSQMVQPQQTTTYTLSLQGYRNTQTGQVLSGQCSTQVVVGGTGTTTNGDPKAQIACSPQSADVGMSVAVSYSCLNSNTSSGAGFATNNQLSGSATPVVVSPSIGSDSVTYGLTCSKEGKTDSAQCTVRVNKTSMVLVANPKNVESGEEANIGWVTSGMQSCTISSPQLSGFTSDNAGNTSVSGVTRTPPLTSDATFVLTCTSRSGATKMVEVKVEVD